jgi:hypothetical protein
VSERLPKAKHEVLVLVKHVNNHIEKACYIPHKTILSADFLCEEYSEFAEEYDEEKDC